MKRLLGCALTVAILFAALPSYGASGSSPWKDLDFISTAELKAKFDAGEEFMLINALSPIEFAEVRITGSVNIPYSILREDPASLPADKGSLLIFYCKGPKCSKSKKSAAVAIERGYTSVFVYDEGLPAWMKAGYPVEKFDLYPKVEVATMSAADLKGMIDEGEKLFLLDVRDSEDRKAGWLKGSVNIPMDRLDAEYASIPSDGKVIVMCLHGKQSFTAIRFLASKGYDSLFKLDGGLIGGWVKSGYPVEK